MARMKWLTWRFNVIAGLVVLCAQLAQPVYADDLPGSINGIYRGTIGHDRIVLEIGFHPPGPNNENNGDSQDRKTYPIEGRYFYRRHGVDIHLVGMPLDGDSFRLREYRRAPDDEFSAEWRIKLQSEHAVGIFCKCELSDQSKPTGKLLKISLKRVSHVFFADFEAEIGDPYYDLLLDFPLKDGPEVEVTADIAYRMQADPRFEARRPRLTRFPDAHVMARINREMAEELRHDRLKAAVNLSEGHLGASSGGFFHEAVEVRFFLPDVLSVLVDQSWYWGGAHPNENTYALNYDLHTGKRFRLDKALQTLAGGTAEGDVSRLLGKLYLRHYVKPAGADEGLYEEKPSGEMVKVECEELVRKSVSDADDPFPAIIYLSGKGLVITPVLPYVMEPCGPEVTIPYKELRPYVKLHSILRSVVDGQAELADGNK